MWLSAEVDLQRASEPGPGRGGEGDRIKELAVVKEGLGWQQGPQSRERWMGHVTMDPGKVLRYGLKRDTEVGYWD